MTYVRFDVSSIFYKAFFTEYSSRESLVDMIKKSNEFEKFYRPFEKKIFNKLNELLGGTFSDNFINAYVLPSGSKNNGQSSPLLIRLHDDKLCTIKYLIHELVHYYITYSSDFQKYLDDIGDFHYENLVEHEIVNWATEKIMLSLFDKEKLEKSRALEYKSQKYEEWRKTGLEKLNNITNLVGMLNNGNKF